MTAVKMVKCKPLDRNLILSHGDELFLEEGKARSLADMGKVTYDGYEPLARSFHTEPSTARAPGVAAPANVTAGMKPPAPGSYLKRDSWAPHRFGRRLLRVLWVQDRSKLGGAELSNDTVVTVGERLGFDIAGVCPGYFPDQLFGDADAVVLNNIHQFSGTQMRRLLALCHEDRLPFIKYEHDYRELSRANVARALFQRAVLAVFLSPRHAERYEEAFSPIPHPCILPLAVDTEFFIKGSGVAEPGTALIPTPQKCGKLLQDYMAGDGKEYRYTVVGNSGGFSPPAGARVTGVSVQTQEGMRRLYQSHQYTVHLPDKEWAGERVVLEAALCGSTPVMNSNVGHKSWKTFPDRKTLELAPYAFWKAVDACI